ncbi:DUF2782 domain-containing protein [Nitrincola tibetensis]|nr:DUF2782 domain-containing protein [Nitrincola tibetensis]
MGNSALLVAVNRIKVHNHIKLHAETDGKYKMGKKLLLLALLSCLTLGSLQAQNSFEEEEQIVIRNDGEATFFEYRVNGVLKEIKVIPAVGPTYYLVPKGEGGDLIRVGESTVLIPKWVIFTW